MDNVRSLFWARVRKEGKNYPEPPAPLMCFEDRMTLYRRQRLANLRNLVLLAVPGYAISFVAAYVAERYAPVTWSVPWPIIGLLAGTSGTAVLHLHQRVSGAWERPYPEEIAIEQAMRRAAGMDDTVAPPGTYVSRKQ